MTTDSGKTRLMIIAADNINAMNPAVADAMRGLDPEPVKDLARRCEQAGAVLLDINPGYLSARKRDRIEFMVEAAQEASSLRLILDSPDPEVLARGLASCCQKPVLSAVSLEPSKLKEILPLAAEAETEVVVLLMDERSFPPPGVEEKLAIAIEIRRQALDSGIPADRLIFDPVLPNLRWPDAMPRIASSAAAVRMLSSGSMFLEPARTMAAISNLQSGMSERRAGLSEACMYLLAGAGLEIALANVLNPEIMTARGLIASMC